VYKLEGRVLVGRQDRDCAQKTGSLHLTDLKGAMVCTTGEEFNGSEEAWGTKLSTEPRSYIDIDIVIRYTREVFFEHNTNP
jgi:hypothetical protein